jgi:hypothetical protein
MMPSPKGPTAVHMGLMLGVINSIVYAPQILQNPENVCVNLTESHLQINSLKYLIISLLTNLRIQLQLENELLRMCRHLGLRLI